MDIRMSPFRRQKRYIQKYRPKWELMREFKYWLKPLPKDSTKAYCSICHVVIKAHLCDLRKHGSAKKHISATKLLKTLKSFAPDESADSEMRTMESDTADNVDVDDDGSEDESNESYRWTREAVESLLRHLKSRWKEFREGLRKKKGIWEDISAAMAEEGFNINSFECGRKFRNIKLRYYAVLEKSLTEETPIFRIGYFNDLHELLSKEPDTLAYLEQKKLNHRPDSIIGVGSEDDAHLLGNSGFDIITDGDMEWTETATNSMLSLLLEFKDWFSSKDGESDDTIWQTIAQQMQADGNEIEEIHCRRKWQNLVEQFTHYRSIAENTGTLPLWPYYTKVRHVMNTVEIPIKNLVERKPMRLKAKCRRRGRPKKRSLSSVDHMDSDASRGEESSLKRENVNFKNEKRDYDDNAIRRVRRLGENATLWERLNSIETRLDDLTDQQELQRATNTLLAQILGELSTLSSHLSPRANHESRMRDDITIVVPQTEH